MDLIVFVEKIVFALGLLRFEFGLEVLLAIEKKAHTNVINPKNMRKLENNNLNKKEFFNTFKVKK